MRDILASARRGRLLSGMHKHASWSVSRDRSEAKAPAREPYDHHAAAIGAIRDWLELHGMDRRTRLSDRIRKAAAADDALAAKICRHVLDRVGEAQREPRKAAAPLPAPVTLTPNQLRAREQSARAHAELARHVATGLLNLTARDRDIERPSVHPERARRQPRPPQCRE